MSILFSLTILRIKRGESEAKKSCHISLLCCWSMTSVWLASSPQFSQLRSVMTFLALALDIHSLSPLKARVLTPPIPRCYFSSAVCAAGSKFFWRSLFPAKPPWRLQNSPPDRSPHVFLSFDVLRASVLFPSVGECTPQSVQPRIPQSSSPSSLLPTSCHPSRSTPSPPTPVIPLSSPPSKPSALFPPLPFPPSLRIYSPPPHSLSRATTHSPPLPPSSPLLPCLLTPPPPLLPPLLCTP